MSVIHVGDFQSGTWNSQTFQIAIAQGGATLPPKTLDDAVDVTTGDIGDTNAQHRGMRATIGNATVVCNFDTDLLALAMGDTGATGIVDDLVLTHTAEDTTATVLTIPDMALAGITPSSIEKGSQATITLEFQRHDVAGTSAYVAIT